MELFGDDFTEQLNTMDITMLHMVSKSLLRITSGRSVTKNDIRDGVHGAVVKHLLQSGVRYLFLPSVPDSTGELNDWTTEQLRGLYEEHFEKPHPNSRDLLLQGLHVLKSEGCLDNVYRLSGIVTVERGIVHICSSGTARLLGGFVIGSAASVSVSSVEISNETRVHGKIFAARSTLTKFVVEDGGMAQLQDCIIRGIASTDRNAMI